MSQINNLSSHPKNLEKEQNKPSVNRRREIIKTRTKINKIENRIVKINETELAL